LYIGVSGGHQRPVAGTLTRLTKHLKVQNRRARLKKRRMSLLKKGAKIHLKNERKIIRPKPPKIRNRNGPQSPTEWRRSSKLKKTAKMKKWMKLKEKLRGNRGSLRSHGGNLRKCMKFEEEYNI
jgi:hypothetical protein